MSVHREAGVVREADLSGALFYGIGIYDRMDGDANPAVMRRLAKDTGGEAYFPESIRELTKICETVARDLRSQYMLSYAPSRTADNGNYHRVEVKVADPQRRKLIVRTRTGYYAPDPNSARVPAKK